MSEHPERFGSWASDITSENPASQSAGSRVEEHKPSLTLDVIEAADGVAVSSTTMVFSRAGGDIGRDERVRWRFDHSEISGSHAVIRYHNGVFSIADNQSTNGSFRQSVGESNRLVPGNYVPVHDGDVFSFAGLVRVRATVLAPNPEPARPSPLPVQSESGLPPWVSGLFDEEPLQQRPTADKLSSRNIDGDRGESLQQTAVANDEWRSVAIALFKGLQQALEVRRRFRDEFSSVPTVAVTDSSSQLKRRDAPESILQDLIASEAEAGIYEDIESVWSDLLAHQMAMMDAIHAGFSDSLAQFEPDALEASMPSTSGISGLIESRWDRYERWMGELKQDHRWAFQRLFERSFCVAYDASVERYRSELVEKGKSRE